MHTDAYANLARKRLRELVTERPTIIPTADVALDMIGWLTRALGSADAVREAWAEIEAGLPVVGQRVQVAACDGAAPIMGVATGRPDGWVELVDDAGEAHRVPLVQEMIVL